jgi:hypothetical protein
MGSVAIFCAYVTTLWEFIYIKDIFYTCYKFGIIFCRGAPVVVFVGAKIAYLVSEIFDNIASAVFRIRLPFNLLFIFPWVLFVAVLSISISIIETYISKKISNKIASVSKWLAKRKGCTFGLGYPILNYDTIIRFYNRSY